MRQFATQLLGKAETVEGTKETLAVGDAVLHKNLAFAPAIDQNKRDLLRGTLSRDPSVSGMRSAKLSFDIELVGSGTAGTAPYWGKFMLGCGFSETIVAATSATYKPATNSLSNSMTIAGYYDGVIKRIWGARGDVKLTMEAGKPGILHFDFEGCDFEMVDGALLSPTYSTYIPPAFLSASLLLDAYAAVVSSVEIDVNNTLDKRQSINSSSGYLSTLITARDPKGSMDPELTTVATYDFYGKWKTPGTLGQLSLSAGATAGNIITVTCPKVRYAAIADKDRGGLRALGLDFQPTLSSGDDEISIVLT
jgi:hypothetical protein